MLNTIRTLSLATVAALSVAGTASALTFTCNSNGGTGTCVENQGTGYDFSVTLVSNNNGVGGILTTASAVAGSVAELITGVWQYSTADIDGSSFDPFGYFVGNVFVQLSTTDPKPAFQNGAFSFGVAAGETWGFYAIATDGIEGSSTSISYGDVTPVPVPLPASGLLLIGALGGVAALRRRKALAA